MNRWDDASLKVKAARGEHRNGRTRRPRKDYFDKALSGTWTDTHSEERKRGISIKLGYADTTFYCTGSGDYYAKGKHPEGKKIQKRLVESCFLC